MTRSALQAKRQELADLFNEYLPPNVPAYAWPAIPADLPCVTVSPAPGTYATRDSMCGLEVRLSVYLILSAHWAEEAFDLLDEWVEVVPTVAAKAGLTLTSIESPRNGEIDDATYLISEVRLQGNP